MAGVLRYVGFWSDVVRYVPVRQAGLGLLCRVQLWQGTLSSCMVSCGRHGKLGHGAVSLGLVW